MLCIFIVPAHPPVMVTIMDDARHRLQARYTPSTGSDDPHCYIQLALIKQSTISRHSKQLNEITKLTLQGHVDEVLQKKEPLNGIKDIFYYDDKPCPRLVLIMGAPGKSACQYTTVCICRLVNCCINHVRTWLFIS